MKALDRNRRVTAVPYQKPGVTASAGLTIEECEAAVWACASDGRCYRGAEAVNVSLAVALGTRLPHILYKLLVIRRLQDLAYDWVAANRDRFPGGEPYCTQHPDQCLA